MKKSYQESINIFFSSEQEPFKIRIFNWLTFIAKNKLYTIQIHQAIYQIFSKLLALSPLLCAQAF